MARKDICEHLAEYLKGQQGRVEYQAIFKEIEDAFSQLKALTSPFHTQEKAVLDEIYAKHKSENVVFNFITYNYTDTLDQCLELVRKKQGLLGSHRYNSNIHNHAVGAIHAKLTHIQFGHGIKKIGADAFLCDLDKKEYLYPKLPIAVFSKGDQRRALYHFVHNAKAGNYNAAAAGTGTLYPFCAPGGGENSCAPLQNFPHHLHTNRRILPMGKSQISARGAPKSACSVVTSKCLFPPRTTPLNCPRPQKV